MGDKEQQTLPDFYALLAKDANQAIDGLLAFLKKSNKEGALVELMERSQNTEERLKALESPEWRAKIYHYYGIYYQNRDAGTARVYYKKALDQFELYPGTEHEQCDLLNELGAMSISAGNATEAEGYSQRAATLAASSQNIKAGIQAKILQADCLRLAGKEEESEEVLLGVLRMAEVKADVNLKRAAKEALTRLSPEPSDSMEDLVVEMCGKLITMKGHVERGNLEAALRAAEEGLVIAKQLQQGPAPETPFHLAIAQIKGLMSAMQPQRIGAAHRKNH